MRIICLPIAAALLVACSQQTAPQPTDLGITADLPLADQATFPDLGPNPTPPPAAGEVIFTEVMAAPSVPRGAWFELRNLSARTLDLSGCVISSDGDDSLTIEVPMSVAAGAHAVFADDAEDHGGLPNVDAIFGPIRLDAAADSLALTCDGTRIDAIAWDGAANWPATEGAAAALDPAFHNASANDDSANWCGATTSYGQGDLGTPGALNPACADNAPCDPNPCTAPPNPTCAGTVLTSYAAVGDCAVVADRGQCSYPPTETDCAASPGGTCQDGVCVSSAPRASQAGDILITELMKDPGAVLDASGEWIELHNPTESALSLSGCELLSLGDEPHAIGPGVEVAAGAYFVLGPQSDPLLNGGVTVDYSYGGDIAFANALDDISVRCDGVLIDTVGYSDDGPWPDSEGYALSLDPGSYDAAINNLPDAWCDAPQSFGPGGYGSPGAANPECPDPCTGIVCDDPPADTCVGGDVLSFADTGLCTDGACTYAVTGSTDCGDKACQNGACVEPVTVAPPPEPGELVISEVMQNPNAAGDADGEWFELTSVALEPVELAGCVIRSGVAEHVIAVDGSVVLSPDTAVVFADNGTFAINGGVDATYVYDDIVLANGSDDLTLRCGGVVIDGVAWDDGVTFPDPNGATMYLDGGAIDAVLNDDGAVWCEGFTVFGQGDFGTPGELNQACPDLCNGVICQTPPAATCVGDVATSYEVEGACSAGSCTYDVAEAQDCGPGNCLDGACVVVGPPKPVAGELVVTEFLVNPSATSDTDGEWIELLNLSSEERSLEGCELADAGTNVHVFGPLAVAAGAYIVIGRASNLTDNGNVVVDYVYGADVSLSNSSPDEIIIRCDGETIDAVAFDGQWPLEEGAATQLAPDQLSATANDDAAVWCAASSAWSGGDFGSPGSANPDCAGPVDPCQDVACPPDQVCVDGACVTVDPCEGVSCDANQTCIDGTCVPAGTGNGPAPGGVIFSEIFYDASGTDDGKEWLELHNPTDQTLDLQGCTLGDPATTVTLSTGSLLMAPGEYFLLAESPDSASNGGLPAPKIVFGASLSLNNDGDVLTLSCGGDVIDAVDYGLAGFPDPTDGRSIALSESASDAASNDVGANWCAASDANPLTGGGWGTPGAPNGPCGGAPSDLPGAGDLVITEIMADYDDGAVGADDGREWFEITNLTAAPLPLDGCAIDDGEGTVVIASGGSLVVQPGAHIVLGQSADTALNGGVAVDYAYGATLVLGNSGDQLILTCGGVVVDAVDFAALGFPDPSGATLALDPTKSDAVANDSGDAWCVGTASYGDGALGSPGAPNAACVTTGAGCDDPPPPTCNGGAVETYTSPGSDATGVCVYEVASTTPCSGTDVCQAGACVDPATSPVVKALDVAAAGSVVITEIMFNPSGVTDGDAEWFEVLNPGTVPLELSGCTVTSSGDAVHIIAATGSLVLEAGSLAVFGVNRDIYSNGGVPVDYVYGGVQLTNSNGDDLSISCGGVLVDAVDYSTGTGFPLPNGASLQLSQAAVSSATSASELATVNDSAANWCATDGLLSYGNAGNAGTPGVTNPACP